MDNDKAKILITAILQGDSAAENQFYEGYRHEVEFLVRLRIGRNNPDLPDLCQTVFIDLFKRIRAGDFDSSKGTPGAFVQSTIKFKVLDYLKSRRYQERKTHTSLKERSADNSETSADDRLLHEEETRAIEAAVRTLTQPYQSILLDYFFNQLKVQEIAQRMGLPEQKISNYKSYALTLLSRKLRESRKAGG